MCTRRIIGARADGYKQEQYKCPGKENGEQYVLSTVNELPLHAKICMNLRDVISVKNKSHGLMSNLYLH